MNVKTENVTFLCGDETANAPSVCAHLGGALAKHTYTILLQQSVPYIYWRLHQKKIICWVQYPPTGTSHA